MIEKTVLLERIALELRDLREGMEHVEATILDSADFLSSGPKPRQSLQEIDRSMQTLECLANCLDAMAKIDPTDHHVPADAVLGSVPLGSVAERLNSGTRFDPNDISGEPDLF